MAVFCWLEFAAAARNPTLGSMIDRYATATDAAGVADWQAFVEELQVADPENAEGRDAITSIVQRFRATLRSRTPPSRDTVFVSHQRANALWAKRVAWEASEAGLHYWLDVHDAGLRRANALAASAPVKAALIAGIIEMALLNCTHIVSVQTVAAQKSRWVPYELGRAKESLVSSTKAASWFETGVGPDPAGDYLSLTYCAHTSQALVHWMGVAGVKPRPKSNAIWRGRRAPPALPN